MTKICSSCGVEKELSEFSKRIRAKDGLVCSCKECRKIYARKYYINNSEKVKIKTREYNKNNKVKIADSKRNYRKTHRIEVNIKKSEFYYNNKDKISIKLREYYNLNRETILFRNNEYNKKNRSKIAEYNNKRYKTDIKHNLRVKTNRRVNEALRKYNIKMCNPVLNLLGCDYGFYEEYIYSKFTEGMNWERFLNGEIHIDHKNPCISFDLTDSEQQKECFHYSNTQPLWAKDNRAKGSKYESAFDGGEE